MRFNSPAECKAEAEKAAPAFIQRHKEHGHDLNPYCTQGGRSDWQRGYDGDLPRSYEISFDYNTKYQLGAATRRLKMMQQFYLSYHGPVTYLCLRDEQHVWYGYAIKRLT